MTVFYPSFRTWSALSAWLYEGGTSVLETSCAATAPSNAGVKFWVSAKRVTAVEISGCASGCDKCWENTQHTAKCFSFHPILTWPVIWYDPSSQVIALISNPSGRRIARVRMFFSGLLYTANVFIPPLLLRVAAATSSLNSPRNQLNEHNAWAQYADANAHPIKLHLCLCNSSIQFSLIYSLVKTRHEVTWPFVYLWSVL